MQFTELIVISIQDKMAQVNIFSFVILCICIIGTNQQAVEVTTAGKLLIVIIIINKILYNIRILEQQQ